MCVCYQIKQSDSGKLYLLRGVYDKPSVLLVTFVTNDKSNCPAGMRRPTAKLSVRHNIKPAEHKKKKQAGTFLS